MRALMENKTWYYDEKIKYLKLGGLERMEMNLRMKKEQRRDEKA